MALEKENVVRGADPQELWGAGAAKKGVPASERLAFEVYRNHSFLGHHELVFSARGGDLIVGVAVDYALKFGPLTFFKYRLRGQERWSQDVLVSARM